MTTLEELIEKYFKGKTVIVKYPFGAFESTIFEINSKGETMKIDTQVLFDKRYFKIKE